MAKYIRREHIIVEVADDGSEKVIFDGAGELAKKGRAGQGINEAKRHSRTLQAKLGDGSLRVA